MSVVMYYTIEIEIQCLNRYIDSAEHISCLRFVVMKPPTSKTHL